MKHCILFLILSLATLVSAQDFEILFPNLSGQELLEAVQSNYTTDTVLSYSMARDTLFANVFMENDSLECVYSGWKRYLDPNLDPTQAVFTNNGGNEDINTEHSYPRSMGALEGTPSHSDMHHLFPTRASVNTARSNDIFMEIPDNEATAWYYSNQTLSNPPTNDIEKWAEDTDQGFEPREQFKGDVARAIFYFYTIYQEQALNTSPEFFELQRETLCHWASNDPAKPEELVKTYKIAEYQGNIPNPFVIDCSLIERLYCQDVDNQICVLSTHEESPIKHEWNLFPNPSAFNYLIIESEIEWTEVNLYDNVGRKVISFPLSPHDRKHTIEVNTLLPAGNYQVQLSHSATQRKSISKTWIKQ